MRTCLLALAFLACNADKPDDTETEEETDAETDADSDTDPPGTGPQPLVVYLSIDTLGTTAAREFDLCGDVAAIAAESGMDAGCFEGGVAPSSWTAESHTRMLWPEHRAGDRREEWTPECDLPGAIPRLADALGARSIWGADNDVLGSARLIEACPDGSMAWHLAVDDVFLTDADPFELIDVAEGERPAHRALDAFEADVAAGVPSVAFVNVFEVGGHFPRCWFAPGTPACDGLWTWAVDHDLVAADADRAATWRDWDFQNALLAALQARTSVADEALLRPLMWGTMMEKIVEFQAEMLDSRLRRIFGAVQAAGREADLLLVIVGDHGENPCVDRPGVIGMQCSHSGLPTQFTANVPVVISPASAGEAWRASGLVGDATTPWSTSNLIYGVYDHVAAPIPAEWPAPEPVGTATSWTCRPVPGNEDGTSNGLRIVGSEAAQCLSGACTGALWEIPGSYADTYPPLAVPASVADYATAGAGNWFEVACAGLP